MLIGPTVNVLHHAGSSIKAEGLARKHPGISDFDVIWRALRH